MLRFFLLLLLALPALYASGCPPLFGNFNGYCWAAFPYMYTHDQAEAYCSKHFGGTLATISSPDLNKDIPYSARTFDIVWLGYKCNSTTQCVGDDGSVMDTSLYFYGGVANPDVGNCVVLDTSPALGGYWFSLDCNQWSNFVCGFHAK